jgi:hypothetical protein
MAEHNPRRGEQQFRPGSQHPEPWREDLNPAPYAGQNSGPASQAVYDSALSAYDVKAVHDRLRDFSDAELKQIPILRTGTRLEQGAVYVDLQDPRRCPFTARGDMQAEEGSWLVPKSMVDSVLWYRLIGVTNPEQLDQADER